MKKILNYNILLLQILLLQIPNVSYIIASEKQNPNKNSQKESSSKKKISEKQKVEEKPEKKASKQNSQAPAAVSAASASTQASDQNKKSHAKMNKDNNSLYELFMKELKKKAEHIDLLIKAIQEQNIQEIQKVIAAGIDINRDATQDERILYEAVRSQNPEILQMLLNAGLKISAESYPLLHSAAEYGNPEIINILLKHGADIHAVERNFGNDIYSLYRALEYRNSEVVKILLDNGANPDWLDTSDDLNSLIFAVRASDVACLKELLDHKSDMTIKEKAPAYNQNYPRLTGYHIAAQLGKDDMVNEYLKHDVDIDMKDSNDRTALHHAISKGQYNVAKLLLSKGADKNCVDKYGITPILLAVEKDLSMFQLLLDYKANIQAVDNEHNTVLHHAANAGSTKIVEELIKINPEIMIDAKNKEGQTPLHLAGKNNDISTVEALLRAGADVTIKDNKGKKPVDYVLEDYPGLIQLLEEAEKKQDEKSKEKREEEK